jgi:Holliday junction resolvase
MTNYRRGYDAERRTRKAFAADGYVVIKSGGSLGPADLVALKPRHVVLVQVKLGDATLRDGWWNELYRLAAWLDAVPVIADWPKRGNLRLRKITGPHHPRSKHWPMRQFLLDEIDAASRWTE